MLRHSRTLAVAFFGLSVLFAGGLLIDDASRYEDMSDGVVWIVAALAGRSAAGRLAIKSQPGA